MKIKCNNLILKTFSKKNLNKKYFSWFKNQKILKFSRHNKNNYDYKYFLNYYLTQKKNKNIFLAIYKKKKVFIGTITANFDTKKKSADLGILIGDLRYRKKGFGLEAWKNLIEILFKKYNLKFITGGANINNKSMINILIKSKMKLFEENKIKKFIKYIIYNENKI